MINELKQIVIDRKTWIRGTGNENDALNTSCLIRRVDNHKCCLGFLGSQIGIPESEMIGHDTFENLEYENIPEFLCSNVKHESIDTYYKVDKPFVSAAIEINDSPTMNNTIREFLLKALFKDQGFDLIFEN